MNMDKDELLFIRMGGKEKPPLIVTELEAEGFHVFKARDPLDGIVHARRREFRAVLLDLSGFQKRERQVIRALERVAPQANFFALLSPACAGQNLDLEQSGIRNILQEPYKVSDLVTLLDQDHQRPDDFQAGSPSRSVIAEVPRRLSPRSLDLLRLWTRDLSQDLANVEEILTLTLELPRKELSANRASLFLVDDDSQTLVAKRWEGLEKDVDPKSLRIRHGAGIVGHVAQHGIPVLVHDLEHEVLFQPTAERKYQSRSFLCVPILHGNKILGVLCFTDKTDGSAFTEAERELVQGHAEQAAAFIENAHQLKRMETLSIVDQLTGLYNRRYFESCLENETIRAKRYKRFLTLALLDIDNFKNFNDSHGYLRGDLALTGVAKILQQNFRKTDIVTRWGGEEFAVLLPETEKPDPSKKNAAFHFTERVRRAIEAADLSVEGGENVRITLSGGVATFPTDTLEKDELLAKANVALKKAKTSGKNKICIFGADDEK